MDGVKQVSSVLETGCTEHRVSTNPCHELKITGIKIDFVLFRVQVSIVTRLHLERTTCSSSDTLESC